MLSDFLAMLSALAQQLCHSHALCWCAAPDMPLTPMHYTPPLCPRSFALHVPKSLPLEGAAPLLCAGEQHTKLVVCLVA